jgi:hypothetical protein
MTNTSNSFPTRKMAWFGLTALTVITLAIVLAPVWIIQPFSPQTQRGLEWSYAMKRWSPIVTVLTAVAALILLVWLWRNSRRWWRKVLLVILFLPILPATWLARQNHFQWLFNPLPNPAYAKASEAAFVADTDVVLSIQINEEAAAYPVRLMAYHHIVEDVVGGTPVVATY